MSRQPTSSSSKYKISAPQPFVDPGLDRFTPDNGPYPSFAPSASRPTQQPRPSVDRYPSATSSAAAPSMSRSEASSSQVRAPTEGGGLGATSGPMRPARSRMRQPPVDTSPGRPERSLRPTLTADTRRPQDMGHDLRSPVSPISPEKPPAHFNDPFAADRYHRTELRDQYKQSERQGSTPMTTGPSGSGTDKLRNVVGAFMSASKSSDAPARRPDKSESRHKVRQNDTSWDLAADGGKFRELDVVMSKIKGEWPFVMGSDFSPSTLALSLLSPQSTYLPPHPSISSFLKLHDSLSSALQSSVQAHFQSFAASLPAHADFLTTLGRAQDQVRTSRQALREAREGFAGRGKSELAGVRGRERTVREMLQMLDTIEKLKQAPDQLESLIGDKRFLPAALLLVSSIRTINKPSISQIGAVSELKAYFTAQETTMTDILIDELQNHLYLKTFYSESRWRPYTPGQRDLPTIAGADLTTRSENPPSRPRSQVRPTDSLESHKESRLSTYLSGLAVRPSPDPASDFQTSDLGTQASPLTPSWSNAQVSAESSATAGNPEADSYTYIENLLEALFVLGKLNNAMDIITQRVPSEIHALVEVTLDEVEERSEQKREETVMGQPQNISLEGQSVPPNRRRHSLVTAADSLRIAISLDTMSPPHHAAVLKDLFWTLYSKLAAVLEGHRVVYEVARWIPSRRDYRDTNGPKAIPNIPVAEIWRPVQQEVRSLLYLYLSDNGPDSIIDRHQIPSVNEVLRDGKPNRDRQRQIFRFSGTDSRSLSNDIKAVDAELQRSLKASVPGLVHMQAADSNVGGQQNVLLQGSLAGSDDQYSSSAKHRTLIPPNAFNVSTLFQPTLSFIERASAIVPPGFEDETSGFGSVLEDFVVKVFLPQLDEKVTSSFQQAVQGYDAYQPDRTATGSNKPPLKSSVRVMSLIHSLCVMLETTPFHKENYSRLIIGVIVQYYQQCSARFRELVALPQSASLLGEPALALPAAWAQREDFIEVLTDMRSVMPADRMEVANIALREVKLQQTMLGDKPVLETQLVNSHRKLEALGSLCESLRWFIDALLDLQSLSEDPLSPIEGLPLNEYSGHASEPATADDPPRLPLTRAMKQRYDAIVQTYEQLTEMVLNSIRLEISCRIICNLASSMQKGDFCPESEALEPDADVDNLTTVLLESEEIVSRTLASEDRDFVFRGLNHLVDHMFIHTARHIKLINSAGVRKVRRNMLALQQSLRGISQSHQEGVLQLSNIYWDMYDQDPKDIIERLKTSKPMFTFEDYNTMLNLICKTDMKEASSSELNTLLIDLHALSMSIDGWE